MRIDQLTKEVTLTEYEYKKLIMAQEELLAKIKAEIERRRDSYLKAHSKYGRDADYIAATEDLRLLEFLDTLESEKPIEGLEEEIERYLSTEWELDKDLNKDEPIYIYDCAWEDLKILARHFAQWGAEHAKIDVTDFCKPIDPGIAQCIADHSWEMLGEDEKPVQNDLEEAAGLWYKKCPFPKSTWWNEGEEMKLTDSRETFIAGAKWQAAHTPLPEDTVLFNKGVEEGKRLMMEDFPKWRRIKEGERLPCPAYVWTIAYDNYPDCFEGRLMPNVQGVKVGQDTWYLPVDVIHNLPKED